MLVLNGYDYKKDCLIELKNLLNLLGLKQKHYETVNKAINYFNEYNSSVIEAYDMIFKDFLKYNTYTYNDLNEIEMFFEELKYEMTEEEIKCNTARINYIKEVIKNGN